MTFDEVDEQMTLPRYNALQRFWLKNPPTAILLKHYVGYKGEEAASTDAPADGEMDEESMSALASIFGMPVRQKQ